MKSFGNYNSMPNKHWKEWEPGLFEKFHQYWEHPAASTLAKQSKVPTHIIEKDADITLKMMIDEYWIPDILYTKNNQKIPKELFDKANEYYQINEQHNILKEYYNNLYDENGEKLSLKELKKLGYSTVNGKTLSDIYGPNNITLLQENNHKIISQNADSLCSNAIRDLMRYQVDHYQELYNAITDLLSSMVKHSYQLSSETQDIYVFEKCNNIFNISSDDDHDVLISDLQTSWENIHHSDNEYLLNLVCFPGFNLPSYYYDNMLYNCYLQNIVVQSDTYNTEKDLIDSFSNHMILSRRTIFAEKAGKFINNWWI